MTQSFSAKKFAHLASKYEGDKTKLDAAIRKGMGFESATSGSVILDLNVAPKDFLKLMLEEFEGLSDNQRNNVSKAYHGVSLDVDTQLESASDVANMIANLRATGLYNAELKLGGRWYPVRAVSQCHGPSRGNEAYTSIGISVKLVDMRQEFAWAIGSSFFTDDDGIHRKITGKEMFQELGLRFLQQDIAEFDQKCSKAEATNRHNGQIRAIINDVFIMADIANRWGYASSTFSRVPLGSPQVPKKGVIESQLEVSGKTENENKDITDMPFVRMFSLNLKRYVYVDVDDVKIYQFEKDAINRIILPPKEKSIIEKLFHADTQAMFGDVLQDKHGGMIILATGTTGTGKTLTAEVFAEINEKPLYVMEMAELGIEVEKMEDRLSKIFQRVTKWNAVLLLDEADVFLAERGESLERAVIVGIFLRLMDYYRGLLFLTTNRPEAIDTAFKSRITIQLDYKKLEAEARAKTWNTMLEAAGLKVKGGLDKIPELDLNGRQIRNMVRLIKVLHGDTVTADQVTEVCDFACK